MSNTTLKVPATITSITINGNVKVPDGNGEISVATADVTLAIRQSVGMTGECIKIGVSKPPIDPTS